MVMLTVVPVIPLALSDAMKAAMFATSSSVMTRRGWVVPARYCGLPESNQGIISLRQQLVFSSFSDDSRSGLVHVLVRFLSGKASVPIEHHFEFCVSSI